MYFSQNSSNLSFHTLNKVGSWPLCILFIIFLFVVGTSHVNSETHDEATRKSAAEWVAEANKFRKKDKKASFSAAKKALYSAQQNNQPAIEAEASFILGEVSKKLKRYPQATEYFKQSAETYKKISNTKEYILSSIEIIKMQIIDKAFRDAHLLVNKLNNLAMQDEYDFLIALTFTTKADIYYKQKQFKAANIQYIRSLRYLTSSDKKVRKKRGDTYKMLAQSYKRLNEKDQVVFYYQKALEDYSSLNNTKLMARTMNSLTQAKAKLGQYTDALDYATQSLTLYDELNDPEGRAKAYTSAGILYRLIGLYEKSLEHMRIAHEYYLNINDAKGIAKSSNQIGLIYTRLKQFEEAKSFYQLTLDLPADKIDATTIASATREIAVIALEQGDYEKSKEAAYKALDIYEQRNDINSASLTTRVIANVYRAEKNYDAAISYYEKSYALAVRAKNKVYQIKAQTPLALMVLEKGDALEAKRLLQEALQVAIQVNNKSQQLYAYRDLKTVEESLGNYKSALAYAQHEINLREIIQKEKEQKDITEAKAKLHAFKMEQDVAALKEKAKYTQLELEKKNNEIELVEQANKISELQLAKNRYANLMLAALLLICLIIVFYVYRRFNDSRKQNQELDYLAARDPLTNCFNRRTLINTLEKDFVSLSAQHEYSLIIVDIDNFKLVNDNYGHQVGDEVLSGVAEVLQGEVRKTDITARYGGEEFCILLPYTSLEKALEIANSMQKTIAGRRFDNVQVTCSFGVSSSRFAAKTSAELIQQADAALYEAKEGGRNRVKQWQPE